MQQAIFGGGCFWCTESVFLHVRGVKKVESGYAGGQQSNPNYEQICSGTTGHAEVIRIDFDETQIHFSQLLDVFFTTHDATTLNRQGNDIGTQYRSVIFYLNEQQREQATQKNQPAANRWFKYRHSTFPCTDVLRCRRLPSKFLCSQSHTRLLSFFDPTQIEKTAIQLS